VFEKANCEEAGENDANVNLKGRPVADGGVVPCCVL
jgi:hypothetical protein